MTATVHHHMTSLHDMQSHKTEQDPHERATGHVDATVRLGVAAGTGVGDGVGAGVSYSSH